MKNRRQTLPQLPKQREREVVVEHILGTFGFTLVWEFDAINPCSVECEVAQIVTEGDRGKEYGIGCSDTTPIFSDADKYLTAYMKWDSCEHFTFGPKADGYLHICGGPAMKDHCALLKYMYQRSFELMGKEPYCESDIWE